MGAIINKKIVVVPGWTYSIERWRKFTNLLSKAGNDVLILNVPGLTSPSKEVWDLEKYIKWLKKEVDKLETKVVLLGHSNGGRIAIAYAAKYPEKLEKLVLMDSAGIYHRELPLRLKRFIFGKLAKFGKILGFSEKSKWIIYKLAREHDYERASASMKKTMVNLIYNEITPFLSKISTPTLIVWGENDKITPISDARLMKELIKNSKLVAIKDARHSPFHSNPKDTSRLILRNI